MNEFSCKLSSLLPWRGGLLLVALSLPFLAASLGAETVRRIKVVADGTAYVWEAGTELPVRKEGQFQDPALAFHLAGIRPGTNLPREELLRLTLRIRRLLETASLYNEPRVFLVPFRDSPDEVTLLIQFSTGFSLRFGGGAAWALVGDDNTDGQASGWRVRGGYNRAELDLHQGIEALSEVSLALGLDYANNGLERLDTDNWRHDFALKGFVATAASPWQARLGVVMDAGLEFDSGGNLVASFAPGPDLALSLLPRLGFDETLDLDILDAAGELQDARASLGLAGDFHARLSWVIPENTAVLSVGARLAGRVRTGHLTLASQVGLDVSPSGLPERLGLDYRDTDDRSVRGDYSRDWLRLDHAVLWNSEIRLHALGFPAGFISRIDIDPFIFADVLAGGWRPDQEGWFARTALAFGPGVRIIFASPVNTAFSFALGMNPEIFQAVDGSDLPLRLSLAVTAGF